MPFGETTYADAFLNGGIPALPDGSDGATLHLQYVADPDEAYELTSTGGYTSISMPTLPLAVDGVMHHEVVFGTATGELPDEARAWVWRDSSGDVVYWDVLKRQMNVTQAGDEIAADLDIYVGPAPQG
jgi:hypothetical protein